MVERDRVPKPPAPFGFHGVLAPSRLKTGLAVSARDLEVAGRLHVPLIDVPAGTRLLVTGANGSGKSTLLKVVAGELARTGGELSVTARRVAHLPQDVVFSRPERSAAQVFAATGSEVPLGDLGLLHPREASRPVGLLSAGQQRRVALALLVARRPDLLLLDEPTNHISLALAEELEESLRRSSGTVLVASHDRWLRKRWDGPGPGPRLAGRTTRKDYAADLFDATRDPEGCRGEPSCSGHFRDGRGNASSRGHAARRPAAVRGGHRREHQPCCWR